MDPQQAKAIIESLLLVADRPLSALEISKVFEGEVERRQVETLLEELAADYAGRTFQVVAVAHGYRLLTRPAYGLWMRRFLRDAKRVKLSRSAIETLSLIAYKQPITKPEIEYLRGGVDASGVLRTLLDRRLIKILGRKQVPGRPAMYGTTQEFLLYFGLRDLTELPTLEEFIDQQETDEEEGGETAGDATAEDPAAMNGQEIETPLQLAENTSPAAASRNLEEQQALGAGGAAEEASAPSQETVPLGERHDRPAGEAVEPDAPDEEETPDEENTEE